MDLANKSLFTEGEQEKVVSENKELLDLMRTAKNIIQWNNLRSHVSMEFKGTNEESLALFGYIDGVLHAEVFGK